jgi:hypothetical protein
MRNFFSRRPVEAVPVEPSYVQDLVEPGSRVDTMQQSVAAAINELFQANPEHLDFQDQSYDSVRASYMVKLRLETPHGLLTITNSHRRWLGVDIDREELALSEEGGPPWYWLELTHYRSGEESPHPSGDTVTERGYFANSWDRMEALVTPVTLKYADLLLRSGEVVAYDDERFGLGIPLQLRQAMRRMPTPEAADDES